MPLERPHVVQRVAPGPVRGQEVVLVDAVDRGHLGVLRGDGAEPVERALLEIEPEPGLQGEPVARIDTGERVPEHPVVCADVVLMGERDLQRIGEIGEPRGLPGSEVPVDVVHRHHRLLEDVLADDVLFAQPGVIEPAVALLTRNREVLAHADTVDVEGGVDAHAPTLEPVVRRGPLLIQVIERHVVRVVLPAARNREIGVAHLSGAEHRLPPVGPGAPRHDQTRSVGGKGIRSRIHHLRTVGVGGGVGCSAALADPVVRVDKVGHRWVVGIPVDVPRDGGSGILVGGLDHLEIIERILDQDIVVPVHRRRHTARHIQRDLAPPRPPLLGFDEDDAVAGARPVNRRRRCILQHLHRRDVVRVQPVEITVVFPLERCAVDDVQRIVVLERADAPDPYRGARPGRPTVIDGHTGHAPIQPLQRARPRLPVDALHIDGRGRAGDVLAPLGCVPGHDHVRQQRDSPLQGHVDGRAPAHALRGAAVPYEAEHEDRIGGCGQRILPVRTGDGAGARPSNAYRHTRDGSPRLLRGDSAGHLDRLLGERRHPHQQCQRESHPHCPKKTRTLEHVVHGAILILRVFAWPGGPAWRSVRDTS